MSQVGTIDTLLLPVKSPRARELLLTIGRYKSSQSEGSVPICLCDSSVDTPVLLAHCDKWLPIPYSNRLGLAEPNPCLERQWIGVADHVSACIPADALPANRMAFDRQFSLGER